MLIAVTDHAVERYRQRVGTRTGAVEVRPEVTARVGSAWAAGRTEADGGRVFVRDGPLVFVCRHDRRAQELVVVTVWEEGEEAKGRRPRHLRPLDRAGGRGRGVGAATSSGGRRMPGMTELGALLTAIVTPFDADGKLDEEAFVAVHRHLARTGSDGIVVAGTTGEAPTLTDEEHLRVIELAVAERPPGTTVVAGAGSNDTRHAVQLTERATELGVDGVLSVTPYYNRPPRAGILAHFKAVAAATDRPIVLYNIPTRTGTDMPNDLLAELAQIDGVEAVKQSNPRNLALVDGLELYAGNDDLVAPTLDLGGKGGICVATHVLGPEFRTMVDDPGRRGEVHASLADAFEVLGRHSPIPIKAALNLAGVRVGGLRLPLVEADDDQVAEIRAMLERHGVLQPATR